MDSGSTFDPNNIFTTPVAGAAALPTPGYLSFAQSTEPDNRTMYLNVEVSGDLCEDLTPPCARIFRSDNRGESWARCDGRQGTLVGYAQTIGVDPQNPDLVYAGLVDGIVSQDKGVNF